MSEMNTSSETNYSGDGYTPMPKNYLIPSILVTLFCCLPFGLVAVIKSSKVKQLWMAKQYDEAYKASADTKKWCIIAAVIGFIFQIIILCLNFFILSKEVF